MKHIHCLFYSVSTVAAPLRFAADARFIKAFPSATADGIIHDRSVRAPPSMSATATALWLVTFKEGSGWRKSWRGRSGPVACARLGRSLTTNGRENKASLVDLRTDANILKADTGEGPDGMLYEPGGEGSYVQRARPIINGDWWRRQVVYHGRTSKVPESARPGRTRGRVYERDLENKNEVAAI